MNKEVIVELPLGAVKGLQRTTIYDESYNSFEGVPYAKPPLGELRFKAAEPVEPWTEMRDCTQFSTKPPQFGTGSEDCLYMNIYTKTLKSDKSLPVLLYLYGGRFVRGNCTREHLGPDYFMFENVLLVVPNYRLYSLGYLSLKDAELNVPGNAGLKDQVIALEWVNKYIKYFNGDAENITLFGNSAGAYAVHALIAAKQCENLFHKAIIMSKSVFDHCGIPRQGDAGYELAKACGYKGENMDKDVLEFLKKQTHEKLTETMLNDLVNILDGKLFPFFPVVEPYESKRCLLPKHPQEMLRTAWSNKIPVMIGGVSFEGLVINTEKYRLEPKLKEFQAKPELLLPLEVKCEHTEDELKVMGEKLRHIYFGDAAREKDEWFQIMHLLSDKIYWHGMTRAIHSRLTYASAPTYLYLFDFDSPFFNYYRNRFMGPKATGVAHADELSYLFLLPESVKLSTDTKEFQTIKRMVGMWTAFAANSNPNCAELGSTEWTPVTKGTPLKLLHINENVTMTEHPEKSNFDVWNSFYTKAELI